jgi:putative colanic acid biosynthesis glycosyltransferase
MNFFSIISICFNNLEELKYTYSSIKEQSCLDFEWIVIDGNSQDGTRNWLQKTNPTKWISEKDKGIYDAMNKGIKMATGHYLIFMNSGDGFTSASVLKTAKEKLESAGHPAFGYGDSMDISEKGDKFLRKAKGLDKLKLGMITQHQAMFFNKEKLNGLQYSLDYPLSADYAFICTVVKKNDPSELLYLGIPICNFNMGGANEQFRYEAMKEDYRIRKEILQLGSIISSGLYALHFIHTKIKRLNPSIRFIRHQSLTK